MKLQKNLLRYLKTVKKLGARNNPTAKTEEMQTVYVLKEEYLKPKIISLKNEDKRKQKKFINIKRKQIVRKSVK